MHCFPWWASCLDVSQKIVSFWLWSSFTKNNFSSFCAFISIFLVSAFVNTVGEANNGAQKNNTKIFSQNFPGYFFLSWDPKRKQHRLAGWQSRVEDSRFEGVLWTQVLVTPTHTGHGNVNVSYHKTMFTYLVDFSACASSQKQHWSRMGEQEVCASKQLRHRLTWKSKGKHLFLRANNI